MRFFDRQGIGKYGTAKVFSTLKARDYKEPTDLIDDAHGVRRLMPVEAERLQGFADNYTLAPFGGKMMSDAARFKMVGNSIAAPVLAWIGARLEKVDAMRSPCP